jgi:hypothetical protein
MIPGRSRFLLCSTLWIVRHATRRATELNVERLTFAPIRCRSARLASPKATTARMAVTANARASASPFQPSMIRLLIPSIRYETGFAVATARNQPISIRFRGRLNEEMIRKTKRSGKKPCTASPEPVRSARSAPTAPNEIAISTARSRRTPSRPAGLEVDSDHEPDADVDDRLHEGGGGDSGELPGDQARPRIGVSASRLRKPVWMSRARSVPAFIVAKSAPCMKGTARANAA